MQQLSGEKMEISVFFSLLLLVCSVSANQTEAEKELSGQQIAEQQPCLQDIHAVLRQLTASLAEQKVEIRILKQENQEQAAKLKEVERQTAETDQLQLQTKVKQVAFSASLLDQEDGDTGPFDTQVTLVFKNVLTNIGNAYNPGTGIFTAPVRGVYHFEWHMYGYGNIRVGAVLFRNGEHIYIAYEHPTSGYVSASNGASLLLEAGDQVHVRLWAGARIHDNKTHVITFSGHLIFTM